MSKSNGGLLAHIIDSRAAARDAPALLCPVERWQEAWFRDNSFLIACLIHTIRNYTAVPCAYARRSRNHSGKTTGNEAARSLHASCSVSANFYFIFFFQKYRLLCIRSISSVSIAAVIYRHKENAVSNQNIAGSNGCYFFVRTNIVNRDVRIFLNMHTYSKMIK